MFHKNWDLLWRSEAGDEEVLLDSLEDHARRNVHKEVAVQLNNSGNRTVQRVKLVRANVKPNLYASGRHPDVNKTWLFVCSGKIKIYCWAFLDGHPVKILKLSYQDMNKKCKTAQTNQIHFLQDLTQICTQKCNQKCNQLLNFPVHTKNYVWFISGWLLDAYRLGLNQNK